MDIFEIGNGWGRAPVECPNCGHEKNARFANAVYECSKCGSRYVVRFDGRYWPNGTPMAKAEPCAV